MQATAVATVKEALTTRPILAIFDSALRTELHTDASSLGLGAILFQFTSEGRQQVVAYYSKQTTFEQRKYHSYELETMAVVFALRHFRVYLLGLNFTVVTDCNALRTTFTKKDLIPRIGRWWLEVQDYTFDIVYRTGSRMQHVDALSRDPVEGVEIYPVDITEGDWILAAQLQDEQLSRVREILIENVRNANTKQYFADYVLKDNKIYRRLENDKIAWVVPRATRFQVCRLCPRRRRTFRVRKNSAAHTRKLLVRRNVRVREKIYRGLFELYVLQENVREEARKTAPH